MSLEAQVFEIRPVEPHEDATIAIIADRMRQTLIEVLGEDRGGAMYSMDWLIDRVRQHLDSGTYDAAVFVAESSSQEVVGHSIVRVESDDDGAFGLFSTFFVVPELRGRGLVDQFLDVGEAWMVARNLSSARTYTAVDNDKLRRVMARHGYASILEKNDMVALAKTL